MDRTWRASQITPLHQYLGGIHCVVFAAGAKHSIVERSAMPEIVEVEIVCMNDVPIRVVVLLTAPASALVGFSPQRTTSEYGEGCSQRNNCAECVCSVHRIILSLRKRQP